MQVNNSSDEIYEKIIKDQGYFTKDVVIDEKWNEKPEIISLNKIETEEEAYLIYFDEERKLFLVSHLLKKIS